MHRLRLGSVIAAAALATAIVIPAFASAAGAAIACDSGSFPATYAAQAGIKVTCQDDGSATVGHAEFHDSDNASWHHGAARTVSLAKPSSGNAITINSATIFFATGTIQTGDIRRPINAFNAAKASMFKGGTFIKAVAPVNCTTTCTSATLSQTAAATGGTVAVPISAKIDYTNNRDIVDAVCSSGSTTVTSASGIFTATDINKGVSGNAFAPGTFITAETATTLTLNQATVAACIAGYNTSIGGATYSGGNPVMFNGDPVDMNLANTTTTAGYGQAFTCVSGQKNLVLTAAAVAAMGGGISTKYDKLAVVVKGTTTVTTTITTVSGTTTLVLAANCPAGITATAGNAVVGVSDANAPTNGSAVGTLGAELNLNPSLVKTQDSCAAGTFEGFEVVGEWENPGAFTASSATPLVSVGQIVFPTSVLSFNGFIAAHAGGETLPPYSDPNAHYDYSFPILPTSLAVCPSPNNQTQLAFGINSTTLTLAPTLATGSGNPGDPSVRQFLPETGTFATSLQLLTGVGSGEVVDSTSVGGAGTGNTGCVIAAANVVPTSLTCGAG